MTKKQKQMLLPDHHSFVLFAVLMVAGAYGSIGEESIHGYYL